MLHKTGKYERRKDDFDAYCFPDIPLKKPSNGGSGSEARNGFRHVSVAENGRPFMDLAENTDGSGGYPGNTEPMEREIEEEAYVRGYTQGEKVGIESGKKIVEPILNNFQQALVELERIRKEIYVSAEKETVELSLAIARKIVGHEVATNRNVVLNVVKEALGKLVDHEKIRVRISPSDLEFILNSRDQFSNTVENADGIVFEEDNAILSGGCVIETDLGSIDARVESQFQVLEDAFEAELQQLGAEN